MARQHPSGGPRRPRQIFQRGATLFIPGEGGPGNGVYRSVDEGRAWSDSSKGLPEAGFHTIVLRDALTNDNADPAGVYFGTRSGEVWGSSDGGASPSDGGSGGGGGWAFHSLSGAAVSAGGPSASIMAAAAREGEARKQSA